MSNVASGRTVFVLGREEDGNRTVAIVENAAEYDMDADAQVEYSDDTAAFPYSL